MLSNGDIADDLEWPLTTQTTIYTFCLAFHIFVAGKPKWYVFSAKFSKCPSTVVQVNYVKFALSSVIEFSVIR